MFLIKQKMRESRNYLMNYNNHNHNNNNNYNNNNNEDNNNTNENKNINGNTNIHLVRFHDYENDDKVTNDTDLNELQETYSAARIKLKRLGTLYAFRGCTIELYGSVITEFSE